MQCATVVAELIDEHVVKVQAGEGRGIIYDEAVTNDWGCGDVERKPESSAERFPPVDVLVFASG